MARLYLIYNSKLIDVVRDDNWYTNEMGEVVNRYDEERTYGSPDVPHGRWSVLYRCFKIYNADSEVRYKVELPDWTQAEKDSIRATYKPIVEAENPKRELTEDEVLDRYYKHDPETGERTDEPTGEFPSIEACREFLQNEIDTEWDQLIATELDKRYQLVMDNCLIAPAAMAEFEQHPDVVELLNTKDESKRIRIRQLDYISRWPLSGKELDRIEEKRIANGLGASI